MFVCVFLTVLNPPECDVLRQEEKNMPLILAIMQRFQVVIFVLHASIIRSVVGFSF